MNALEGTAPRTQGPFTICILIAEGQRPLSSACDEAPWKWTSVCSFQSYCTSLFPSLSPLFYRSGLHLAEKIIFIYIGGNDPDKQSFPHLVILKHTHTHTRTQLCALYQASSSLSIVWSHFQLGLFCGRFWKCSSFSPMDSDRHSLRGIMVRPFTAAKGQHALKSSVCKNGRLATLPLTPLKCIKVNNARPRGKSLCPPRLSEVKKAMNMKCAMNKLCCGGNIAKKTGCEITAFSENHCVAFLIQWNDESATRIIWHEIRSPFWNKLNDFLAES